MYISLTSEDYKHAVMAGSIQPAHLRCRRPFFVPSRPRFHTPLKYFLLQPRYWMRHSYIDGSLAHLLLQVIIKYEYVFQKEKSCF